MNKRLDGSSWWATLKSLGQSVKTKLGVSVSGPYPFFHMRMETFDLHFLRFLYDFCESFHSGALESHAVSWKHCDG